MGSSGNTIYASETGDLEVPVYVWQTLVGPLPCSTIEQQTPRRPRTARLGEI